MIRYLTGTVKDTTGNRLILLTESGVGYLVATPSRLGALPGEHISLFIHLAVRETALDLYGFQNETDLDMFELLLTISGVGPKSALQIMEQADTTLLLSSIGSNDAEQLTKLAGMSKKTAEKIVLGLKDKVDHLLITAKSDVPVNATYQDAFDTLITLGYNPQQVRQVLESLKDASTTTELVRAALQEL